MLLMEDNSRTVRVKPEMCHSNLSLFATADATTIAYAVRTREIGQVEDAQYGSKCCSRSGSNFCSESGSRPAAAVAATPTAESGPELKQQRQPQ